MTYDFRFHTTNLRSLQEYMAYRHRTGPDRFTEISQIFKMTQNRGEIAF